VKHIDAGNNKKFAEELLFAVLGGFGFGFFFCLFLTTSLQKIFNENSVKLIRQISTENE